MKNRFGRLAAVLSVAMLVATACGGSDDEGAGGGATGGGETATSLQRVGGSMEVAAVWSSTEQANFKQVLDAFTAQTGTQVTFTSTGDDIATVLRTRLQGGSPPDVAVLPQPGLLRDLVGQNALEPIDDVVGDAVDESWPKDLKDLGSVNGALYGMFFKGANKSLGWYNVAAFRNAGVTPPATFDELLTTAQTVRDSGVTPFAFGGGSAWTLTDLFENIYLRQAGPEKYDQLSTHAIPWTDQSVKDALTTMGRLLTDRTFISGSPTQTTFQQAVDLVFSNPPSAAMILEGDFVPGAATQKREPVTDYDAFAFPSIGGSRPSVVAGGDAVVMMKDTPQARELIKFLATAEAAEIWAKLGGFSSPNKDVDPASYPDDVSRKNASSLAEATLLRFDMSDLAPAEFGGTPSRGEWALL
ncbi:MAG TPA: extracellular solute-binding protein, partial [Acidimicrobiales bacterium]|nr:extracellular solute-binding protein [Acidimicrobiales bacterium]